MPQSHQLLLLLLLDHPHSTRVSQPRASSRVLLHTANALLLVCSCSAGVPVTEHGANKLTLITLAVLSSRVLSADRKMLATQTLPFLLNLSLCLLYSFSLLSFLLLLGLLCLFWTHVPGFSLQRLLNLDLLSEIPKMQRRCFRGRPVTFHVKLSVAVGASCSQSFIVLVNLNARVLVSRRGFLRTSVFQHSTLSLWHITVFAPSQVSVSVLALCVISLAVVARRTPTGLLNFRTRCWPFCTKKKPSQGICCFLAPEVHFSSVMKHMRSCWDRNCQVASPRQRCLPRTRARLIGISTKKRVQLLCSDQLSSRLFTQTHNANTS